MELILRCILVVICWLDLTNGQHHNDHRMYHNYQPHLNMYHLHEHGHPHLHVRSVDNLPTTTDNTSSGTEKASTTENGQATSGDMFPRDMNVIDDADVANLEDQIILFFTDDSPGDGVGTEKNDTGSSGKPRAVDESSLNDTLSKVDSKNSNTTANSTRERRQTVGSANFSIPFNVRSAEQFPPPFPPVSTQQQQFRFNIPQPIPVQPQAILQQPFVVDQQRILVQPQQPFGQPGQLQFLVPPQNTFQQPQPQFQPQFQIPLQTQPFAVPVLPQFGPNGQPINVGFFPKPPNPQSSNGGAERQSGNQTHSAENLNRREAATRPPPPPPNATLPRFPIIPPNVTVSPMQPQGKPPVPSDPRSFPVNRPPLSQQPPPTPLPTPTPLPLPQQPPQRAPPQPQGQPPQPLPQPQPQQQQPPRQQVRDVGDRHESGRGHDESHSSGRGRREAESLYPRKMSGMTRGHRHEPYVTSSPPVYKRTLPPNPYSEHYSYYT